MTYITLEEVKAQCRVEDNTEDTMLGIYGNAAEEAVIHETGWTADELVSQNDGAMPDRLRLAMRLIAAHWFRVRESVTGVAPHAVPYAYEYLVKPFTKLSEREEEVQ